jgi:pimeloyl-ACP methyl ester carboxylesterase
MIGLLQPPGTGDAMPKVFIHGNPENDTLWTELFRELEARGEENLMALSPPGFGAPLPQGFDATQSGYRSWLIAELEKLGGNVDIVGHDWGALHVYAVLAERPDLIRSWAADVAGIIHPDYVWHDHAQAWQTPAVGEQAIAELFEQSQDDTAEFLTTFDIPLENARALAQSMDETMGACVLSLYRSAAQPEMANLGRQLEATEKRPGLVFIATEDPFTGTHAMCETMARVLGAEVCPLDGLGHWWMFPGAAAAAEALTRHWQ